MSYAVLAVPTLLTQYAPSMPWNMYGPFIRALSYGVVLADAYPGIVTGLCVPLLCCSVGLQVFGGGGNEMLHANLSGPAIGFILARLCAAALHMTVVEGSLISGFSVPSKLAAVLLLYSVLRFVVSSMIYPAPFVPYLMAPPPDNVLIQSFAGLDLVMIPGPNKIPLRAAVVRVEPPTDQWLLYIGGNGEIVQHSAECLHQLASGLHVNVLGFNHRGVAGSAGAVYTSSDLMDDAKAVLDYLVTRLGVRPREVIVFGHSIGGGTAAQLVSQHYPDATLVLDRTFSSLGDAACALSPVMRSFPSFIRSVVRGLFGDLEPAKHWQNVRHERKVVYYHRRDQIIRYNACSIATKGSISPSHMIELIGTDRVDPHNSCITYFNPSIAGSIRRLHYEGK